MNHWEYASLYIFIAIIAYMLGKQLDRAVKASEGSNALNHAILKEIERTRELIESEFHYIKKADEQKADSLRLSAELDTIISNIENRGNS